MDTATSPEPPVRSRWFDTDGVVITAVEHPVHGSRVVVEWRDGVGDLHCEVLTPERSRMWMATTGDAPLRA